MTEREDLSIWHQATIAQCGLVHVIRYRLSPHGKVWRRYVKGKWEYQQDPETDEEWLDRV